MTSKNLMRVYTCQGQLEARILESLFQAHEIPLLLSHEAAGAVYGLGVGDLGRVDLLVAEDRAAEARDLLNRYFRGELESEDSLDDGS